MISAGPCWVMDHAAARMQAVAALDRLKLPNAGGAADAGDIRFLIGFSEISDHG